MKKLWLLFAFAVLVSGQETLTNDSIIKMAKAGLGEGLIVSMIQSQPGNYKLTTDELVRLKQQGVSEKELGAMIAKGTGGSSSLAPSTNSPSAPAPSSADLPQNIEIGAYYRKDGQWQEMLPEVVNWKTGGVLKHIASAGVVKGDVNGHIDGGHSRNSIHTPFEFLIYEPEGVAITEYQLVHLHETGESREFRTVTGGVMHESGGATRDLIPFEGKKIATRTYRVVLPSLGAGEYGFLPPGAFTAANSASIGKMYTFRLLE